MNKTILHISFKQNLNINEIIHQREMKAKEEVFESWMREGTVDENNYNTMVNMCQNCIVKPIILFCLIMCATGI